MALHMSVCWHTPGMFVPKLLGYGRMYDGLLAFIAMSAGVFTLCQHLQNLDKESPTGKCSITPERSTLLATCKQALTEVHTAGLLHGRGNIHASNIIMAPTCGLCRGVWLIDLPDSHLISRSVYGDDPAQQKASELEHSLLQSVFG